MFSKVTPYPPPLITEAGPFNALISNLLIRSPPHPSIARRFPAHSHGNRLHASNSIDLVMGSHPLDRPLLWSGSEDDALHPNSFANHLTPSWKIMLLSDGSVTRHLQLMTGLKVSVECLEMRRLKDDMDMSALPRAVSLIQGPLLQRQVLLHLPEPLNRAYVYAVSWWNADTVERYLKDKDQPIWVSLSRERTEMYRDILELEYGQSAWLEEKFGSQGPFWGRSYVFWHGDKPLTLIYEVFSTGLCDFLGPTRASNGSTTV